MPTNRWTGGANDGNWGTATNWSLAAAPVDLDDVIIDATNQSITAGLNQTGINLSSLTISSGVNIGGSGSSLIIGVSGTCKITGTGQIYLAADAVGTEPIDRLIVQTAGAPTVFLTGGTVTLLEVAEGASVSVANGCTVTTCYTSGGVNFDANATGVTTLEQDGGYVQSYRSIATANIAGDSATVCRLVQSAALTTAAVIRGQAKYIHNSSGTITLITVHPQAVATSQGSQYNFTITNSVRWYGGALFDTDVEPASITYTNAATKVAYA